MLKGDLNVLYNIWFKPMKKTKSHKDRLDHFYSDQAKSYDSFRKKFLWGREHMMSTLCAYLDNIQEELVWIDLGGGTGANMLMMFEHINPKRFKKIYIIDLCKSLCDEAQKKVNENNLGHIVEIICMDATIFKPEFQAHLVTFSYSLSMMPNFLKAVDNAISVMRDDGYFGITDFYVSSKYDQCYRQMSWFRRVFWKSIFDLDGIYIGPERRMYIEHKLKMLYEKNADGSLPYVPFLKPPYYIWIGNKTGKTNHIVSEHKKAPVLFPPTFLYHQSWEDPREDEKVLDLNKNDVCLTLTSGGCNSLNLLLNDVKHVVSVDINPAQSALLELKTVALQELEYDDFWDLFGKGKSKYIAYLYENKLEPFLSEMSRVFWDKNIYFFNDGLYYHGSMGNVCKLLKYIMSFLGITKQINNVLEADSINEQVKLFNNIWCVWWFMRLGFLKWFMNILLFNSITVWYAGGVPNRQRSLILKDENNLVNYMGRCINGILNNSHIKTENYFYYNIFRGMYSKINCPAYLKLNNYLKLRDGRLQKLTISTNTFIDELKSREYSKVILMDHMDWQNDKYASDIADSLWDNLKDGGITILRSASYSPFYLKYFEEKGFDIKCVSRIDQNDYLDRVNMYASFYVIKKPNIH